MGSEGSRSWSTDYRSLFFGPSKCHSANTTRSQYWTQGPSENTLGSIYQSIFPGMAATLASASQAYLPSRIRAICLQSRLRQLAEQQAISSSIVPDLCDFCFVQHHHFEEGCPILRGSMAKSFVFDIFHCQSFYPSMSRTGSDLLPFAS